MIPSSRIDLHWFSCFLALRFGCLWVKEMLHVKTNLVFVRKWIATLPGPWPFSVLDGKFRSNCASAQRLESKNLFMIIAWSLLRKSSMGQFLWIYPRNSLVSSKRHPWNSNLPQVHHDLIQVLPTLFSCIFPFPLWSIILQQVAFEILTSSNYKLMAMLIARVEASCCN